LKEGIVYYSTVSQKGAAEDTHYQEFDVKMVRER
jgi:hypothetical protein